MQEQALLMQRVLIRASARAVRAVRSVGATRAVLYHHRGSAANNTTVATARVDQVQVVEVEKAPEAMAQVEHPPFFSARKLQLAVENAFDSTHERKCEPINDLHLVYSYSSTQTRGSARHTHTDEVKEKSKSPHTTHVNQGTKRDTKYSTSLDF